MFDKDCNLEPFAIILYTCSVGFTTLDTTLPYEGASYPYDQVTVTHLPNHNEFFIFVQHEIQRNFIFL